MEEFTVKERYSEIMIKVPVNMCVGYEKLKACVFRD